MDKTITISGKPVRFRKTGGTVLRYKREFGREFNADLAKIAAMQSVIGGKDKKAAAAAALSVETEWMYDMAFIMAQQADPTITDELTWLDSFDDFDPWAVFSELMELISKEQEIAPKNV